MSTLFRYYKNHIGLILLAFAFLFIQAQCDLALPDYMSRIVSNGIAISDIGYIMKNGAIMLLISLLGVAAAVSVGFVSSRLGAILAKDMRTSIFAKVSSYSNTEFDKFSTSSLITRSTNDITQILMFTVMLIRTCFYAPIMGFGGVIKCVTMSQDMPQMSMVIAIAVGALIAFIIFLLLVVQPKFSKVQKLVDKTNLVAREGLTGMLVIRAFNTQKFEEERFDRVNSDLTKLNLFVNRIMAIMMPFMTCIMNGLSLAIVWIAAISAQSVTDVGNMMAFMQYSMHIIMSFMFVSMMFILMPRALVSANRIGEVLNSDVAIQDLPDAKPIDQINGVLKFENVSFTYPGGEDPAISNISFTAKPGQTTAFIGSTGSGKSTLISLIPRLYDATEGKVTIDGIDVRDMTKESLRRHIGYVPQKNVLFSGTIASNLLYGYEADPEDVKREMQENNLSEEEATAKLADSAMKKAAQIAQASEFINEKPDKYDSEIAQSGGNVSGGQKQRLAIARALVKKCPIYVFDDSFSALDFKTDAQLRKALKAETTNATVLIVAQRVGTIMGADQIIVLDEGKIAGIGTHRELLQNCQVYADIAHSQLSEEELA